MHIRTVSASVCASSPQLLKYIQTRIHSFFYVLLTVHLSIILVINQPDAQNLVLQ